MAKSAKYGSWESPITSKLIAQSSRAFQEIHVDLNPLYADAQWGTDQSGIGGPTTEVVYDQEIPTEPCYIQSCIAVLQHLIGYAVEPYTVYWNEMRYDDDGRYVICSQKTEESKFTDWIKAPYSARTTVHEYGGGAFFVYNGEVYFSNFDDQRMYLQKNATDKPKAITPERKWRYADGVIGGKSKRIYTVREDHTNAEKPSEVVNTLVTFDPSDSGMNQTIIAEGRDFYSSPRVSPDGNKLAWFEWNFPNMPWDNTDLYVATLDGSGKILSKVLVAGGSTNPASVMQPFWGPDNALFYISDLTNWWNIYRLEDFGGSGSPVNILKRDKETGGPQWTFAEFAYAVDQKANKNRVIATSGELIGEINLKTLAFTEIKTGFTSHDFINVTSTGEIYCVAAGASKMAAVIKISADFKTVTILRESKVLTGLGGFLSRPQEVEWKSTEGGTAYGFYYSPTNKNFVGIQGTLPPLLVKTHGGPTAATNKNLNLNIQYCTSRGFAVLDTNYRGSTGYGRTYRHALNLKWGIYDIDDVTKGAEYFASDKKLVDKDKLCIDGGSAGGYTTLAALTFRDTFKTGVSNYGICDLGALMKDTHKFESKYPENLVAPWPSHIHIYRKRSPVYHVENLTCSMAFFQGGEDKVVPPEQSKKMYNAVYEKNRPCMFTLFPDEQHGFRQAQNIEKSIDGEFYFFSKCFDFEAYNNFFPIDNLPQPKS